MEIIITEQDHITLVAMSGDLDGKTSADAQAQILPLVHPETRLLLDMTGLRYMSSAGLRTMLLIYRKVSGSGGSVVLAGLAAEIRDTMSATGFLDYFITTDTVEAGLAELNNAADPDSAG